MGLAKFISAAFSPDGRSIAIASDEDDPKKASIWDAKTGAEALSLGHTSVVTTAHFSSDGSRIVTASLDKIVRVWDAARGSDVQELLGHESDVNAARFSVDGTRIVTASGDRTVRVWDTQTGAQMIRFAMSSAANDAAFTRDGSHVVAMTDDGNIVVFDVGWTMRRGEDLAGQVCAAKLSGVAKLTPEGDQNPILSIFRGVRHRAGSACVARRSSDL